MRHVQHYGAPFARLLSLLFIPALAWVALGAPDDSAVHLHGRLVLGVLALAGVLLTAREHRRVSVALGVEAMLLSFSSHGVHPLWLLAAVVAIAMGPAVADRMAGPGDEPALKQRDPQPPALVAPSHGTRRVAQVAAGRRAVGKGVVYGTAGANISASGFGEAQVRAGSDGERRVGAMLEEVVSQMGSVAWHGLHFRPNSTTQADVDHAIMVGNELWLVDAKLWAYGTYRWRADGTISRDGGDFSGGNVHMADAVAHWNAYLPCRVRAFIVMAAPNSTRYNISGNPTSGSLTLTTTDALRRELLAALRRNNQPVDTRVERLVTAQKL